MRKKQRETDKHLKKIDQLTDKSRDKPSKGSKAKIQSQQDILDDTPQQDKKPSKVSQASSASADHKQLLKQNEILLKYLLLAAENERLLRGKDQLQNQLNNLKMLLDDLQAKYDDLKDDYNRQQKQLDRAGDDQKELQRLR